MTFGLLLARLVRLTAIGCADECWLRHTSLHCQESHQTSDIEDISAWDVEKQYYAYCGLFAMATVRSLAIVGLGGVIIPTSFNEMTVSMPWQH